MMNLLYGDLDPTDAGQIVSKLETMSIPYQIKGDGTQIYVPGDQVAKLRVVMAESGVPSGGSIGYEIFDRSDGLGMTNFVQDINQLRALEGEIARTIKTINGVGSAKVHLVLPKRQLFSQDSQKPSASVMLKMRGAIRLLAPQVQAVQHLVAAAVPGLSPDQISIVDDKGTLLARGGSEGAQSFGSVGQTDEVRVAFETRLARSIESLLERSTGPGKVRAEVSAELDFAQLTENHEVYDPNGQVVRSTQTTEEGSQNNENNAGAQGVSVQNNLPPEQNKAGAGGSGSQSQAKKNEEVVNYEISKVTKVHVKEMGSVKRLSVAVLVDGNYTIGKDGKPTDYKPRAKEELSQFEKLVKTAIGFKDDRGDKIEVINMKFAETIPGGVDDSAAKDMVFGFKRHEIMHFAELLVLLVVGALIIFVVIKPLIEKIGAMMPDKNEEGGVQQMVVIGQDGVAKVQSVAINSNGEAVIQNNDGTTQQLPGPQVAGALTDESMVSVKNIEGQLRAATLKKVADLIEQRPEESVGVVRTWMAAGR